MITVAVVHHDEARRQAFCAHLAESLRGARAPYQLYSIKDVRALADGYERRTLRFDVMCLDAGADEACVEKVMAHGRGTEFVLLDATHDRLVSLLRYKPAAALDTSRRDAALARDAFAVCVRHLARRNRFFCVQTRTRSVRIPYDSILYFESSHRKVVIHADGPNDLCAFAATLDSVEEALPQGLFVRCHQSYLVRGDAVRELDRTARALVLSNGEAVDVSKRYYRDVSEAFSGGTLR